jgi:hypothetical protein
MLQGHIHDRFVTVFLVEDVDPKQPLSFAGAKWIQVDVVTLESYSGVVERSNSSCCHEDSPPLTTGNEPQHPRRFLPTTWHHDDVVDLADWRPTSIQQW